MGETPHPRPGSPGMQGSSREARVLLWAPLGDTATPSFCHCLIMKRG